MYGFLPWYRKSGSLQGIFALACLVVCIGGLVWGGIALYHDPEPKRTHDFYILATIWSFCLLASISSKLSDIRTELRKLNARR